MESGTGRSSAVGRGADFTRLSGNIYATIWIYPKKTGSGVIHDGTKTVSYISPTIRFFPVCMAALSADAGV
ncbi:hypothetical protein D3C75_1325610 [compost metagenome]